MSTNTQASEYLQTFPDNIIAAVARGDIDLNRLAIEVLANRGLDHNAKWIGFDAAARLKDSRT